ncbi:protein DnaJ [Seminavis robusta]|uniref:Protein DnaJ n=1 Tax=Seminavis robusta TaxID=568900 RepID=A0A9N8DBM0_9STRA|nr:protein DnaJ [Seminavis robusta]|eukprot:Sro77_g042270.1 protein DnaJ (256) ;mRNA; r:125522-126289
MSQRGYVGGKKAGKDLYKLLEIQQGSTLTEIKTAYKKLALKYHPDRNQGDATKTQRFKDVSEAYTILSHDGRRRQYDLQHGFRYNQNRRTAPPKNYRKVYTPVRPPKSAQFNHDRHYEMHYGRGMMDQAVHDATKRQQQKNGKQTISNSNGYHSPLGQGFSFGHGGINDTMNPYSRGSRQRQQQQQQETVWEYEEGTVFDGDAAKGNVHRREEIIADLNGKRIRRKQQQQAQAQQEMQNNQSAFQAQQQEACLIQ